MPLFEFKCPSCKNTTDVLMRHDDVTPQTCPKCGTNMVKVFSAPVAFDFRGAGFYVNDYKGK